VAAIITRKAVPSPDCVELGPWIASGRSALALTWRSSNFLFRITKAMGVVGACWLNWVGVQGPRTKTVLGQQPCRSPRAIETIFCLPPRPSERLIEAPLRQFHRQAIRIELLSWVGENKRPARHGRWNIRAGRAREQATGVGPAKTRPPRRLVEDCAIHGALITLSVNSPLKKRFEWAEQPQPKRARSIPREDGVSFGRTCARCSSLAREAP